ncbi:MAG: hypothetical protein L0214_13725 [candidate division NC10 bacterium]|nr:hypothetical protein [candidate division NC10 bacterium]
MLPQQQGDGSAKLHVHQADMGGWVRVYTDETSPLPKGLATYLSLALTEWFRQRPQLHLRCVVSVARDGNTAELHGWYDVHVLPNTALQS